MFDKEKEHAAVVSKLSDHAAKLLSDHATERNQWYTERTVLNNDHANEIRNCNQHLADTVKEYERKINALKD